MSESETSREKETGSGNAAEAAWPLRLVGTPTILAGYTHGHRYRSLMATVAIAPSDLDRWLPQVEQLLVRAVGPFRDETGGDTPGSGRSRAVSALLGWTLRIQIASGVPLHEGASILFEDATQARLRIPSLVSSNRLDVRLLAALVKLSGLVANGDSPERQLEELADAVEAIRQNWQHMGGNVPRLLKAAHEKHIPFKELPGNVIQYGYGSRARWMTSSFTDMTSRIGAVLARSKEATAAILNQAGVPAPRHLRVESGEGAVAAAERLGYPVVVKPADKDGGTAVAAGLTMPDQVRRAFARAVEVSPNVLVEKHFVGRDYRMTVYRSELVWAAERIPGGIVGDGQNSIARLVEMQAGRGLGSAGRRKYELALDEEAFEFLGMLGLTTDSVPARGQSVRLRGAANLARGGTVAPVMHLVHPDNRVLAVRAADALRLDLAGVDFLIEDIAKSWLEVGALVCEVNAQPDLGISGPHLYGEILDRMLGDDCRIPIAVVLGAEKDTALVADIARSLAADGKVVGQVDSTGVKVGGQVVAGGRRDSYAGSQMLMLDRTVDAAVIAVNDASLLRTGLAFDRFDVLIVAGMRIAGAAAGNDRSVLASLLKALLPMCSGTVLTVEGSGVRLAPPAENGTAVIESQPVPISRVARTVAARMTRAVAEPA